MGTCRISGALGCLLILATCCTVTQAAHSTGHGYETKSFAQAYLECLKYLNISRQPMLAYDTTSVPSNSGGNCLLRCIGLNTRWWNDETGLNEKALVRFFRQTDPSSLDQARTCVAKDSDTSDTCAAAYRSFRCYSDALGEVIAHPEYVAPCREEIHRAVSDCAAMLQVSDEQLTSCVGAESFQHSGNTTTLLRCVVLRLGLYADSTGVMCDRLQLLMDSDTAQSWTESRAEEAKRCENDLRVLGADVCLVAAHSVEICYGWMAFGELWKVMKEEYGNSDNAVLYDDAGETLVEVNDATEEAQEQQNNDVYPFPKDVEVFSYPSSSRYRSLLIVAPKWIASDSKSDEDRSDSSQEEKTASEDKLETHNLLESDAEKPTNPDNAVQQQTVPEPEEMKQPATEHIVHTRSVMYPMAPELFPYCRQVMPPYALRMRRSMPLPHYYPHSMPAMDTHYYHPIMKRSIATYPMYAPAYRPFVPARFVRDVDSTVSQEALGDAPAAELSEPTVSQGLNEFVSELADDDSTVTRHEERSVEASSDREDSPTVDEGPVNEELVVPALNEESSPTVNEGPVYEELVVPALNEESSEAATEEALNVGGEAYEETEPVSLSNVVVDASNGETVVDDDSDKTGNSEDTSDDSEMPLAEVGCPAETDAAAENPESSSTTTDNSVPIPTTTDQPKQPIHPQNVHRLIRAVHASNLIKNILSTIKTH
ncbi:uncharacterized protein LOC128306519 [Anopheles moucheti]|uniref:uncharacterized protein LOC128306519 n=1 Tax=Anopheles moucheti TaxID=186751 RepID=UPI0022F057E4|nr:uncharacterized protein LOC128306519 [Anopheles moucheti]